MSEYTTVYLRHKDMPLLKKKEHPSHEECQSQSKEDLMKVCLLYTSPSPRDA